MRSDQMFRDRFAIDTSLMSLKQHDDNTVNFENVLTRVFTVPTWHVSPVPTLQRMYWHLYDGTEVPLPRLCKLEVMDARWHVQTVWPDDEPWLLTETFAQQAAPHLQTEIRLVPGTYTAETWPAAISAALQVARGQYSVQLINRGLVIRSDMSQPVFELKVPLPWAARTGALFKRGTAYVSAAPIDLVATYIAMELRNARPREDPTITLLTDPSSSQRLTRMPLSSATWTFEESERPVTLSLRLSVLGHVVTGHVLLRVWTY